MAQQHRHYATDRRADHAGQSDFLQALHQQGEVAERIFGILTKNEPLAITREYRRSWLRTFSDVISRLLDSWAWREEPLIAGLCATCGHMRRVTSDRGSVFYLCELSKVDPTFPKYPRLPVLECGGYEPAADPK